MNDISPDNVYVNAVIKHNPAFGNNPSPAEYNITKTQPIIGKGDDYYVSVIRFDIPLSDVPLYIFPVLPNQSDPNLSSLIIGVSAGGVDYPNNLVFVTQNPDVQPPVQDKPFQVVTPYYYCYSYQNLIDSLNIALLAAWFSAGSVGIYPPFFYLDVNTYLIKLVLTSTFVNSDQVIFINTPLLNFIDTFNYITVIDKTNGHDYNFNFSNDYYSYASIPDTTIPVPNFAVNFESNLPPTTPSWYIYSQEISTLNYWTALRKIIITSDTIPIVREIISNVYDLSQTISVPIITDFVPTFETANQTRNIAYYYPTSQYRLVDIIASRALTTIDLKIFWQDKAGNNFPLNLSLYQEASIKLAFVKKTLYKNENKKL